MKKYGIFALTLVLTASVLTGCRSKNDMNGNTSEPTIMPTVEMPTRETTVPTSAPTTEATVMPTDASDPSETETVGEDGFVGSDPTESSDINSRSRKLPRGR